MKLLYIANIRLPTEKAHGIQIMKMCEAFALRGVKVKLVVPRRQNNISEDPFVYYDTMKVFSIVRIPTIDLGPTSFGFRLQTVVFSVFSFLYTLSHFNYKIYSRDDLTLYFLSFIVPNKLYWEVHTNRYNRVISRLMDSCQVIFSVSAGLRDFFISKGVDSEKILVAHDGVDVSKFVTTYESKEDIRFKLSLPQDRAVIAYVGKYKTMSKDKGIDSLIHTFPRILKKNPEAFLLLVGINQNELNNVQAIFHKMSIKQEDYKIVLHVPQSTAILYMRASDIMIMNYPNIEHYALYMSPLKMFEYMASGNIIVAPRLPSILEVLNDTNAILVESDSQNSFSDGVFFALNNIKSVKERALKALSDVRAYSWESRAESIKKQIWRTM